MSEQHKPKKKLFGVISRWVVYLTAFTMIPLAIGVIYWGAQKVVTYGSLPDRLDNIRLEMTNELASFKYDNDSQYQALRKEMARRFDQLETRLDQLQGFKSVPGLPYVLSTNPVILLGVTIGTNRPPHTNLVYNLKED